VGDLLALVAAIVVGPEAALGEAGVEADPGAGAALPVEEGAISSSSRAWAGAGAATATATISRATAARGRARGA